MNYRHAYHAGNHADVLKHLVLSRLLALLAKKDAPYAYLDSHAGIGLYDLRGDQASRTGEWLEGIQRVWQADDVPALFDDYLGVIRALNPDGQLRYYPGSPEVARDLLKRYLDYRLAMADLPAGNAAPSAETFAQHLEALTRLRGEYFSAEESQAFFSSDLSQDQFMLAQLRLNERGLSPEQQRHELALLEASLPAEQRAVRQQVSRDGELYAASEALRAAGASDEAIYQLRASTLDPQAASALQQLDEQRRQWQARLQAYAAERNRLRQSGLSPTDQQLAIEQLLAQGFDERERLRVMALDAEL